MVFKAFAININTKEEEIIKKMAAVVNDSPVEITDLLSYTPTINNTDILFLYGRKAQNYFKNSECRYKVEFPDISVLVGSTNNKAKQEAYKQLLELKEKLSRPEEIPPTENKKLTAEPLPDISPEQILILQEEIIENKKEYWQGKNKQGNTIRLTVKPETSEADINMTFAELYTLKIAMEVLQLKEIEIVPCISSNKQNSRPKN